MAGNAPPSPSERESELEAVVRFYANPVHHRGVGTSRVYSDAGRRARQVLGECVPCVGFGLVWDERSSRQVLCPDCNGTGLAS